MDSIQRRDAKSGKVSFADPVVISETTKSRVVMIPFFVPHTDHTELAIKIVTYRKAPPPMDWAIVEEKSVSLKEDASRKLLKAMQSHLAVCEENDNGNYLVIRVTEGTADIGKHDPMSVAKALTNVLSQEGVVEHLANTDLCDELLTAFRGAIRLKEMRAAVAMLREHLEQGDNDEQTYQRWCEQHTWAFGSCYVIRDNVRTISAGDKLDLILPTVMSGYRDLVELKRPDMCVLNYDGHHQNYYFAADVSKALGQCHRYLDIFHEAAANGLRDHPEVMAYHPRATLVIGRSNNWQTEMFKTLHGLNRRLNGITVMTYDQLLAQGERLIEILAATGNTEGQTTGLDQENGFDDEMPF